MKTHIYKKEMKYDGSQLRHCFAYGMSEYLKGDSIVSFIGPCEVKEHLVDLEDSLSNDFISSENMMHFIVEIFDVNMTEAVLWQRTLIHIIMEELRVFTGDIFRTGDDMMFLGNDGDFYKLSVSIATLSRFSGLIHVGINIVPGKDCPVKAIGLKELGLDDKNIKQFQEEVVSRFAKEFEDIKNATYKVIDV